MDSNITYISSNDKPIAPDVVDILYENRDTVKCTKYIKLLQFYKHSPREVAEHLYNSIIEELGDSVKTIIHVKLYESEFNSLAESVCVYIEYKSTKVITRRGKNISDKTETIELKNGDQLEISYHVAGGGYMHSLNIKNSSHPWVTINIVT